MLIELVILFGAAIVIWPLIYRGTPWRVAVLPFPLAFLVVGLITDMTNFLPRWAELLLWGWMAVSSYAVLLGFGYFFRPWMDERGWRW